MLLARGGRRAGRPLYFLDLHTSSADGPPFLTVGDTLYNRRFARGFPLPLILGLEEQVDGALLEYLNNWASPPWASRPDGTTGEDSVDRIEAVLWLALSTRRLIGPRLVPDLDRRRRTLIEASRGIPRIVEVRRRHAITGDDELPHGAGFGNFDPVRGGTVAGP